MPLALCDQRTVSESDWVVGKTISKKTPDPVPFVSSVGNGHQRWYYFSDMTPDEVLVFKQYDSDASQPMGCLHGAFKLHGVPADVVPRASVEARMMAFFE